MRLACACVILIAGCSHNVYFSDDEGGPRGNDPAVGDHPDELSLPYALGSKIDLTLERLDGRSQAWSVVSDQPGIFSVDGLDVAQEGTLVAHGRAVGEGIARLRLVDAAGHDQRCVEVTVTAPDEARLYAHGPLRIASHGPFSAVTSANVLADQTAVFAIAYFRALERVYGHGLAVLDAPAALGASTQTSAGRPVNEWLFVKPSQSGEVAVNAGTTPLGTLAVTVAMDSQIDSLALTEEVGAAMHDGDQVWMYADARNAVGEPIYGVYCDWSLDGVAQSRAAGDTAPPVGDLYRYHASGNAGALRTLTATHGGVAASAQIAARDGEVVDTTYLGCSTAPGRAPSRAPLAGIVLLAALVLRLARRVTPAA
jgi:hypothetical protein